MRRRMRVLAPHFVRAVSIGKEFQLSRVEATSLADTLDGLSSALFLVDANSRIVYANRRGRAILVAGNVLYSVAGKLAAVDTDAERALFDFLLVAAAGDRLAGVRGPSFPLRGSDGETYVAHVLPLTAGIRREASATYNAVAAVFVRKAELALPHPVETLAKRYKLTAAEMRVLLAIVEIGGVPDVARMLAISETTVKTHLQRVFGKTGVARQADLVKLVAGFAGPFG